MKHSTHSTRCRLLRTGALSLAQDRRAVACSCPGSGSTTNISGADNDFGRPSGTGLSASATPGPSFLATIGLSLRDKSHSPIEGPRTKFALMGLKPWQLYA